MASDGRDGGRDAVASLRFLSPSRQFRPRHDTSNASSSSFAAVSHERIHDADAEASTTSANGNTMSVTTAVFNLASAVVGAGIMALPNAFRVLGVVGGCLALVVMHCVTQLTLSFLMRATAASGARTYAALTRHYLGPTWKRALQASLVLNNFGIMVVYQIIFGDILAGSMARGGVD